MIEEKLMESLAGESEEQAETAETEEPILGEMETIISEPEEEASMNAIAELEKEQTPAVPQVKAIVQGKYVPSREKVTLGALTSRHLCCSIEVLEGENCITIGMIGSNNERSVISMSLTGCRQLSHRVEKLTC